MEWWVAKWTLTVTAIDQELHGSKTQRNIHSYTCLSVCLAFTHHQPHNKNVEGLPFELNQCEWNDMKWK